MKAKTERVHQHLQSITLLVDRLDERDDATAEDVRKQTLTILRELDTALEETVMRHLVE